MALDEQQLMIVDERAGSTQAASSGDVEMKTKAENIVSDYKREAESLLMKIEKQQDDFQQEQVAQFFQQIDLAVGTKTRAQLHEIKVETR